MDHATWATAVCTEDGCGRYLRCCAGCGRCAEHHAAPPVAVVLESPPLAGGGVMTLKNDGPPTPDEPEEGMGALR